MEQEFKDQDMLPQDQLQAESYKPRPGWQVWLARIGLVVFIAFLVMYYMNILRGGR